MIPRPGGLRIAAAASAALAAALALSGGRGPRVRVLVLDVSRSVAPGEALAARGREALEGGGAADRREAVAFADGAAGLPPAGTGTAAAGPGAGESDVAAGLRAALSRIPAGARGEILLATDGRATRGDAPAAAAEALRRGVAVRTLPPDGPFPVRAARVDAPATARPGDRIPVAVVFAGSPGERGTVRLEDVAAGEAEAREVRVPPGGRGRVVFARVAGEPGVRRYRASCPGPLAAAAPEAAVLVEGEAAVLRLGSDAAGAGTAAFLREAAGGPFADAAGPEAIAAALEGADLAATALLVLDDLPERMLPPGGGESIRRAVEGGMGLLVLGGPRTLGPGGFAGRPVEEALPVRCAPERPRPLVVLALDVSGSMEGPASGGMTRAAAVRAAAGILVDAAPRDARLALVLFDDGLREAAGPFDLGAEADRARARGEAAAVRTPGGGTRFGAAVEGALAAAARAPGPGARTLLLVTDGRPSEDAAALGALGARLRDARFAVRVVPVAEDPDRERLEAFAVGAGGAVVAPAGEGGGPVAALAAVLREAASAADPALWRTGTAEVRPGPDPAPFGRVPAGLPAVEGRDRVFAREDARTWLLLEGGDPLLVGGSRGLGRAAVFAAPPEGGGAAWATGAASSLLASVARWALRAPGSPGVEAGARSLPDGTVEVGLRTLPEAAPDGPVRAAGIPLRRTGPCSWEGRLPPGAAGEEGVVAFASGGTTLARVAAAPGPSAEDAAVGPDREALAALEVPPGPPRGRRPGAGIPAAAAGLAALALLLAAAVREGGSGRGRPRVEGGRGAGAPRKEGA